MNQTARATTPATKFYLSAMAMAGKNTAVFGIYADRMGVERAVDALREAGFRAADISVLFPENAGTKDFAVGKG